MNREVDKLIFNALAQGRDVCLPGKGSLIVCRNGARKLSSRRMQSPHTDIIFSSEQRGQSVPDMIVSISGVTPERAADIYAQWLRTAERDGVLSVDGVGELREGKFITNEKFDDMANPEGKKTVDMRPRTNYLLYSFAAVCILFAVIVAGYVISSHQRSFSDPVRGSSAPVAEQAAPAVTETPAAENAVAEDVPETVAEQPLPSEPVVVTEAGTEIIPMTAGNTYAVWGVYVQLANAEEALRTLRARYDDLECGIYDYGDRYMVALNEFSSRSECVRFVESLKSRSKAFREVWAYTCRK